MKNKVLLLMAVLVLCITMVFLTSCDLNISKEVDHEAQAEIIADDLLADEDFMEAVKGSDGVDGVDGVTPSIGENGNWFVADVDLGIKAAGTDGIGIKSVEINAEGNLILVYTDDTTIDLGQIKAPTCEHSYGPLMGGIPATCTSIGYTYQTCSLCGHVAYMFQAANGHVFGEPITIKQGINGVLIYTCSVCSGTKVETAKLYSDGLEYSLIDDNSHYRVDGIGTCTDVEIIIPDEHEGKPVTEIGEKAFYESADLVSVVIPETVVRIGDKAFSKCEKLENVNMSDSIEIGLDVFRGSINVEIKIVHTLIHVPAKEASCTEAGNIEYYYCEPCHEYYKDANGEERIYEVTIAPSHIFEYGACTKCGTVQDEINIVSVDMIGHLGKFALGTLEDAIGLPSYINVITADGMIHTLAIDWDMSGYVKNVVGEYTIEGYIQLGIFQMAEGLTNRVEAKVEIVDYMEGTADVVFILDISGSMGDEISNVKNNIIAFAQAIEAQGVSARWSAITYSDFEDCPGVPEEETQIVMNGAEQWFVSAEEYQAAISNIYLAGGGDGPEVAIDGLMMANTLSTRTDARVFYILLTDADYKVDNHYGVESMDETVDILNGNRVNVSVITSSSYTGYYNDLYETTGGIYSNIYGDFSNDLLEALVPIIYTEVVS